MAGGDEVAGGGLDGNVGVERRRAQVLCQWRAARVKVRRLRVRVPKRACSTPHAKPARAFRASSLSRVCCHDDRRRRRVCVHHTDSNLFSGLV